MDYSCIVGIGAAVAVTEEIHRMKNDIYLCA